MFEAVILAGGQGTRLKGVTGDLPKPMVDINGIPFLYKLMKKLETQGCSRIVLSLCYRADYIIERVKKEKPVNCLVDFIVEKKPLDTGGAIKLAASSITAESFIVLNGDTYSDIDYKELIRFSMKINLVISGVYVDDVSRYGTLDVKNGYLVSINEKGAQGKGIINSGTYVINTKDILSFPYAKFSFEREFIPQYIGTLKVFVSTGYFIDIGIPNDYYKFCQKQMTEVEKYCSDQNIAEL